MSRVFYSLSSPLWSNFGTNKGLPISWNGVFINDNMELQLKITAKKS